MAYLQQADLDHAIEQFRKGVALDQNDPALHYNLGLALKLKDNLTAAVPSSSGQLRLRCNVAEPTLHTWRHLHATGTVRRRYSAVEARDRVAARERRCVGTIGQRAEGFWRRGRSGQRTQTRHCTTARSTQFAYSIGHTRIAGRRQRCCCGGSENRCRTEPRSGEQAAGKLRTEERARLTGGWQAWRGSYAIAGRNPGRTDARRAPSTFGGSVRAPGENCRRCARAKERSHAGCWQAYSEHVEPIALECRRRRTYRTGAKCHPHVIASLRCCGASTVALLYNPLRLSGRNSACPLTFQDAYYSFFSQ